ncbi:TTLL8 [Symbiodinium natans]|uniref:TTLL8 protein n=1 Tax=Symbiodinium natans TaxID=878477 RepID=A0A812L7U4_9DINO|nr:TTLL8 [Symbiodinium natans]
MGLHQRAHVDLFLSQYMKPRAECVICSAENAPSTSRGYIPSAPALRLRQDPLDGPGNVWALKEPCVQKGKGVTVLAGLSRILTAYETHRPAGQGRDCVAQKYIERPLLVPRPSGPAKCDLRVWVLVLDWNPLTAFVHPEVYFRVATLPYELDSMAPNAHKTNCRDAENRTPMKVLFEQLGSAAEERWRSYTWPRQVD